MLARTQVRRRRATGRRFRALSARRGRSRGEMTVIRTTGVILMLSLLSVLVVVFDNNSSSSSSSSFSLLVAFTPSVSPSNDAASRANGDFGGRCILFLLSPLLLYLLLLVVYVAFRKREEAGKFYRKLFPNSALKCLPLSPSLSLSKGGQIAKKSTRNKNNNTRVL